MAKLKNSKSILSRLKITGSGKMMRRKSNQSHFNSKDSGNQGRSKHKAAQIDGVDKKAYKKYLPYTK